MNEPFRMTKRRGFEMIVALLPQTFFILSLIGFVVIFFVDRNDLRIFVGVTIFFLLMPLAAWYGSKKWNILIKKFQEEDKELV